MDIIKQISKPSIEKPSIEIPKLDPKDGVLLEQYLGQTSPLVYLSGIYYKDTDISEFKLSYGKSLLPSVKIVMFDKNSAINTDYFDTPDTETFIVYMKSTSTDFLPISIRFLVTNMKRVGSDRVSLTGEMFLPDINNQLIKSYKGSSFSVMKQIADELSLGFASNVKSSADEQVWMRLSQGVEDFIQEVASHAWINDMSSVKVWIDPYYVLNYFDAGEAYKTDKNSFDKYSQTNKFPILDGNKEQSLGEFLFTNAHMRTATDTYIQKYVPFDRRGYVEKSLGFSRVLRTEDLDRDEYFEYDIKQVALNVTIKRSGDNSRNIYVGFTNENTHRNYNHAYVQNEVNSMFYSAVGLKLKVAPINPTIYAGMIVPVMLKNDDANNIDLKGGEFDAEYNTALSAFYVIEEINYLFSRMALSTEFTAIKIRNDIKSLT